MAVGKCEVYGGFVLDAYHGVEVIDEIMRRGRADAHVRARRGASSKARDGEASPSLFIRLHPPGPPHIAAVSCICARTLGRKPMSESCREGVCRRVDSVLAVETLL